MSDINVDIARLQKEISEKLGLQSDQVVFDFSQNEGVTKLDLITISARHDQSFLYHTTRAIDKKEALGKMLEYIAIKNTSGNTYTLQWIMAGEAELHTSYFRARNMYEALDKFYYNREMNSFNIFSITLNPVA
jgi:hypothetical protein